MIGRTEVEVELWEMTIDHRMRCCRNSSCSWMVSNRSLHIRAMLRLSIYFFYFSWTFIVLGRCSLNTPCSRSGSLTRMAHLADQDERLNLLSHSIGRQNHLSIQIGSELDLHNELLEDTDHAMDRTTARLSQAKKRLDRVASDAKQYGEFTFSMT